MKYLIVAKYQESLDWLADVPADWQQIVIEKGKDLPNEGREGSSFLLGLMRLYPTLRDDDTVICLQGDPFPHVLADTLKRAWSHPFRSFQWLGSEYRCDGEGAPDHKGLPIAQVYEAMAGAPLTKPISFAAGGQFAVMGREVTSRQLDDYKQLFDNFDGPMPWVMERLWGVWFCG